MNKFLMTLGGAALALVGVAVLFSEAFASSAVPILMKGLFGIWTSALALFLWSKVWEQTPLVLKKPNFINPLAVGVLGLVAFCRALSQVNQDWILPALLGSITVLGFSMAVSYYAREKVDWEEKKGEVQRV